MTFRFAFVSLLFLIAGVQPIFAKGAPAFVDDRWNPAHVSALPPLLRIRLEALLSICGPLLEAEHSIATYIRAKDTEYAVLHFESLRCANRKAICRDGRCLHEVYKMAGGRGRLILQRYVNEMKLTASGEAAFVEVDCGSIMCGSVRLP